MAETAYNGLQDPLAESPEAYLWLAAGEDFTGVPKEELHAVPNSPHRDELFKRAIAAVAAAGEIDVTSSLHDLRRHRLTIAALQTGQSPTEKLQTQPSLRTDYEDATDSELAEEAGEYLRLFAAKIKKLPQADETCGLEHAESQTETNDTTDDQTEADIETNDSSDAVDVEPNDTKLGKKHDSLQELIPAAVAGDKAAIDKLIEQIHPMMLRYCRGHLGRQETTIGSSEDVAQDICIAVFKALPSYSEKGLSFRAYAYGIAAHKVTDTFRAIGRNRSEAVAILPEAPALSVYDNPEARLLDIELSHRLSRLLGMLSSRQREVLVLRIAVGLSAEETAETIGSTPGAVRVTQHRALAKLREVVLPPSPVNAKPDLIQLLAADSTSDCSDDGNSDTLSATETAAAAKEDHRINILNQYTNGTIGARKAAAELSLTTYELHQLYSE